MVTLDTTVTDGPAGVDTDHYGVQDARRSWILRGVATLSLGAAAFGGALGAGHWLASHGAARAHAVAAPNKPHRVAEQAEPLIQTPPDPVRAVLSAGSSGGIADWGWAPSPTVTLRVSLVGLRESVPVRAQAEIEPAGLPFTGEPTVSGAPMRLQAQHMRQRLGR